MSTYTLKPSSEHGVSRAEVMKQFFFFLRAMRESKILEKPCSLSSLREEVAIRRRWGSLESGTLAINAKKYPDELGFVDEEGELTYLEFFDRVYRLAHGLQERGVHEGDNVAVMALNGRAAVFPLCARQMLGYHIFMINANSSGQQIHKVLGFHDIDAFVVDQEFYDRLLPETKEQFDIIIGFVDDEKALDRADTLKQIIDHTVLNTGEDRLPEKPTKSQHVVMTSGTTGMPKGVIRRQLLSPQGIAPALATVPWRRGMNVFVQGTLFHFYGWGIMMVTLVTGSTIITRRKHSSEQTLQVLKDYKVNGWCSSASRLRAMISELDKRESAGVSGLEWITSSGSPLTPFEVESMAKYFGPVLVNSYGSTETSAIAMSPGRMLASDPLLTGRIYPGAMVEILDDDGNPVPDGEMGEVYAGCYDMFVGYTDPDIKPTVNNGLIRMGDKGYRKGDRLYVVGRADDLVITQFAEKIFPSELEDVLIRDERVAEVHVHGVRDDKFGQALRCYVIREDGISEDELNEDVVKELLRTGLSDAHVPRDVFFVHDFPRNAMGKVIRPQLPDHSTA